MKMSASQLVALLICVTPSLSALSMGADTKDLPSVPLMGFNTWNQFACNISEALIKDLADSIVELGLDKLGYNYLNIDDCWQADSRDEHGRIQSDPTRF